MAQVNVSNDQIERLRAMAPQWIKRNTVLVAWAIDRLVEADQRGGERPGDEQQTRRVPSCDNAA